MNETQCATLTCAQCKADMEPGTNYGPRKRFCSAACRRRASRDNAVGKFGIDDVARALTRCGVHVELYDAILDELDREVG